MTKKNKLTMQFEVKVSFEQHNTLAKEKKAINQIRRKLMHQIREIGCVHYSVQKSRGEPDDESTDFVTARHVSTYLK